MKFGEKIKILRVLEGMNQGDLAEASGLQQSVIGRYEGGDVVPYTAPLVKIAEALKIKESMKWLQGKEEFVLNKHIIYRPMSPFSSYIPATVRSIDVALTSLLPGLVQEMGLNEHRILQSQFGSILIAHGNWDNGTNKYQSSIAVVCREEIAPSLEEGFPNAHRNDITDEDMLNVLFYSSQQVLHKYTDFTFLTEFGCHCPEKNKDDRIINIKLKGTIPITVLNDIEQYINNLIAENGIDVEVTISGRDTEGLAVEQLVDQKMWKHISKQFKFNESKTALVPI